MQFFQIKEIKGERCTDEYYKAKVNTCFTQTGGNVIKTHGKREVMAMLNAYNQSQNLDVFGTQDATIMSHQEKYRALRAFNIIKENWCGKIKVRMCIERSCQHNYILREEAMSPAIAVKALFSSLLIDAHKGRAIQNFDVLGAYGYAPLPDDKVVHMEFEGKFVDIICKVNPEYEKFVTYEKVKKVLYVLILKAIYGMI